MAPLRVLITTDAVGGVWTYALDLASGLAGSGFAPTLAVLGPGPSAAQRAAVEAVAGLDMIETELPLDWTASSPAHVRNAAASLAGLARVTRADIVLLHAPAFAVARYAVPVVAVHHSCVGTWWHAVKPGAPMPSDLAWRTELTAEGLRGSSEVVAPTAAHARLVAQVYELYAAPRCIHNGRRTAANIAAERDALFVLTAGRLWDEAKNLAALDEAAARISAPLITAGPLHAEHAAVSLTHGKTLGPVDEASLRRWMARAPVFASMAVYEPFGYCVLEAAQAGCALVLSDMPGFRELWDGAAVFASPRDPVGIANAINGLLFDADLTRRMGQAARQRAGRYAAARMVRETAALLRATAGRAGQGAAA